MIKNIERKQKLVLIIAGISIIASVVISLSSFRYAYNQIQGERDKIYVLDNGVPLLVNRVDEQANRHLEYETTINMFHNLFFTLPPDDEYIKKNIEQSMYLIDKSGVLEYNNLKEKGYYNQILSSSAVLSVLTDSVVIDMERGTFDYYGRQRIDRSSKVVHRSLHTAGNVANVPRTENNPLGAIITNWRTISNKDIFSADKKSF